MGQPIAPQDSAPDIEDRVVLPKVELKAQTRLADPDMCEDYPNSFTSEASDGEHLVEFAGRQCYESFHNPKGRTTEEYIQNIIAQEHFSVLEHTSVTFHLTGVSRSLTHDLIRHRHLSYSQLSQRFVDSSWPTYVCPPLFRNNRQLYCTWINAIRDGEKHYKPLLYWAEVQNPEATRKQIREAVRAILPNCVATKIVVTGNLRTWRELLQKRWSSHADAEIAEVAGMLANALMDLYPSVFEDISYVND